MTASDGFTMYICDYGNNAIRTLNTRTLDVGTYVSGAPLDKPIHLTVARSGNLYVSCAPNGGPDSNVVKVTTGRVMSVVGSAHQARGIGVNDSESLLYLMEQGHYYFTEIWRGYFATMTTGGSLADHTNLGIFSDLEGGCMAPDGYFYGVAGASYHYANGAGFKRFNESGLLWSEAPGGDYGRGRRSCAVRPGSDGRLWFYNIGNRYSAGDGAGKWAVFLTKIDLGGGIFSDEIIGNTEGGWGTALNDVDTVYFSACGLEPDVLNIQGPVYRTYYTGVGSGLNSIYKIGCPPNPIAVVSNHEMRVVVDDGVQTVRGKLREAPKREISELRDRCGRPIPAELSKPKSRLRARLP